MGESKHLKESDMPRVVIENVDQHTAKEIARILRENGIQEDLEMIHVTDL